jgi:hypothetical protein
MIAAETNLAEGELLRVMENGKVPTLRGRTRIPLTSKEDEQLQKNIGVN